MVLLEPEKGRAALDLDASLGERFDQERLRNALREHDAPRLERSGPAHAPETVQPEVEYPLSPRVEADTRPRHAPGQEPVEEPHPGQDLRNAVLQPDGLGSGGRAGVLVNDAQVDPKPPQLTSECQPRGPRPDDEHVCGLCPTHGCVLSLAVPAPGRPVRLSKR